MSWPVRTCRVCGCTQTRACPGGCWWVGEDLCSACAPPAAPADAGALLGALQVDSIRPQIMVITEPGMWDVLVTRVEIELAGLPTHDIARWADDGGRP